MTSLFPNQPLHPQAGFSHVYFHPKMKRLFSLFLLFLSFRAIAAPRPEVVVKVVWDTAARTDGAIPYNRLQPLHYEDFRAPIPPDVRINNVARTVTVIDYKMKYRRVGERTEVMVILAIAMVPKASWMKLAGREPDVLRHEQFHFHLAALWACEMGRRMKVTSFQPEGIKEQLAEVYQAVNRSAAEEQARYDRETIHGTELDVQEQWEKNIAGRLRQMTYL